MSVSQRNIDLITCSFIPLLGVVTLKNIIAQIGDTSDIFRLPKSKLLKLNGVGETIANSIITNVNEAKKKCEHELNFIANNNIFTTSIYDNDYPKRLKRNDDAPFLLYYKGNLICNENKYIAIVGTRKCTDYGKNFVEKLIKTLASNNVKIISGMAYGIDIAAHKSCIENDVYNIGVLGHGLHTIYPSLHKKYADSIIQNGCLLSEFNSQEKIIPENFATRNRIIAGMCDAIAVIETDVKGGSMITAKLAFDYNRDVFALPGNIDSKTSSGCNFLIKTNLAQLIDSPDDIIKQMQWATNDTKKNIQKSIFVELNDLQKTVWEALPNNDPISIDNLILITQLSHSKLASAILEMEMMGILKSIAGARVIKI